MLTLYTDWSEVDISNIDNATTWHCSAVFLPFVYSRRKNGFNTCIKATVAVKNGVYTCINATLESVISGAYNVN